MKRFLLISVALIIAGCAHAISQELRDGVDWDVHPEALLKDPEAYKGKLVLLGGVIVSAKNTPEGTYLEILEMPLDSFGRPEMGDRSRGRFIILAEGYLDTAVFGRGREVAVAGEVSGKMVRPLDDVQYTYLLVKSKELHLFEPRSRVPFSFGIGVFHSF